MSDHQTLTPRSIGASRSRLALYVGCFALLVWVGWVAISVGDAVGILTGTVILGIAGVSGMIFFAGLVRGGPKLAYDQTGLVYVGLLRTRRWRWAELGPFHLSSRTYRWRRIHNACAFLQHHHALLQNDPERAQRPIFIEADINIPLSLLVRGIREADAAALVAELNSWRARYGVPKSDLSGGGHSTTREELNRTLGRRHRNYMLVWVATAIAVIVIGAFAIATNN